MDEMSVHYIDIQCIDAGVGLMKLTNDTFKRFNYQPFKGMIVYFYERFDDII